jgi:superfamily II DNA or RNA helicase
MDVCETKLSKQNISKLRKELRMVITSDYGDPKVYNIYNYKNKFYTLPLHWAVKNLNLNPTFEEPEVVRVGKFNAILRPEQEECIEKCNIEFQKPFGGGIINASTGSGKSLITMAMFANTSYKTLIVVHTTELLQQWKRNISNFLPDVNVGIIQGKIFDITDKEIVIGMLQTVSMKANIDSKLFKRFGLVVYDEVQFLAAEVFSKTLLKTRAKYTFGLSATVERKDGMEIVFKHHIGDIIYSNINNSVKQYTEIRPIFYSNVNLKEKTIYNGTPNISAMINDLASDNVRSKMIVKELLELPNYRNVLVLSERVEHLRYLQKLIGNDISGLFIGVSTQEEKRLAREKRILFATYHIASVGFDHPKLDTLLFATPRSNITQAIGRIYRRVHETNPMIIDIVDSHSVFPYQYKKRDKIYKKSIETRTSECLFE